MAAQMTPRFRDLPDVDWTSFADGEVATYDGGTDTLTGEVPVAGGGGDLTQADLDAHNDDTSFVHGIVNTGDLATDTELAAHSADTTAVHGIANTANIILLGDSRLTDSRAPNGAAGGVLGGTYPNPSFAADMATQAELDAVAAAGADLADAVVLEPAVSDRNVVEGSANVTLLRLKAHPDQSVALQEWRNSADEVLADLHLNDVGASAELKLVGASPQINVEIADTAGAYQQAGAFYAYPADGAPTDPAVFVSAWSDTTARWQACAGGALQWGDGTAAADTTLERTGAGVLEVNGEAVVLDDDARLVGGVDQGDIDNTVATHSADTTSVHGITDTTVLATDAEVASAVSAHESDTSVHGIADTTVLATDAEVATAVSDHSADTTSVHGVADTSVLATDSEVATAVSDHSADTTAVHGIADTSALASLPIAEANVTGLTAALAAKQPVDSDLTALAALSTTSYGRSLLEAADAAGAQTTLGVSTFIKTLLDDADAATARTTLGTTDLGLRLPGTMTAGRPVPIPFGVGGGTGAYTLSRLHFLPLLWIDRSRSFDRIGINVSVLAASSTIRFGLYADNGGTPGTLITDYGTVDSSTTGIKQITIAVTLTAAMYWVGVCCQGGTPSVTRIQPLVFANLCEYEDNPAGIAYQDSVTGALPSPAVVTARGLGTNYPAAFFRTAA